MTLISAAVAKRGSAPPMRQWWSRAWQRMVEESRSEETEWTRARRLARSGQLGPIRVTEGRAVVTTAGPEPAETALSVGVLEPEERAMFADLVAASGPRLPALLAGRLELELVEEAEELGVELTGGFGSLEATCSCASWHPVCVHALALAIQVGWAMERDAWVLLTLRGMSREEVVAQVRRIAGEDLTDASLGRSSPGATGGHWLVDSLDAGDGEAELSAAVEAVLRARRMLAAQED